MKNLYDVTLIYGRGVHHRTSRTRAVWTVMASSEKNALKTLSVDQPPETLAGVVETTVRMRPSSSVLRIFVGDGK